MRLKPWSFEKVWEISQISCTKGTVFTVCSEAKSLISMKLPPRDSPW